MVKDRTVDKIRSHTDIVRLIEEYFPLKKTGNNYKALCPFHQEKTPSFVVSPEKQLYHCFGCGASGNVFNFVMEMEKIDFPEALRRLAQRNNIEIDNFQSGKYQKKRELKKEVTELNSRAAKFYHRYLYSDSGKSILNILKDRGIDESVIKKFHLGYAPGGNKIVNSAKKAGIGEEILLKSGLVGKSKSGRLYDKFQNRIMFPIFDERGDIKGFGGRVVDDDDQPKYLNTAQTEVFEKKKILYGLYQGKDQIRKTGKLVLLEGYMDVISAYQNGIPFVVAALGTALTSQHVYKLKHWVDDIIICFDYDEAGKKATVRAIDLLLSSDINSKVCVLPEGKDPEDVLKEDKDKFLEYMENAKSGLQWRMDYSVEKFSDISDRITRKSQIVKDLAGTIDKIEDPVKKQDIVKVISEQLSIREGLINRKVKQFSSAGYQKFTQVDDSADEFMTKQERIMKELLHIVLRKPDLAEKIEGICEDSSYSNNIYHDLLKKYIQVYNTDTNKFISSVDSQYKSMLSQLAFKKVNTNDTEKYIKKLKEELEKLKLKKEYQSLVEEINEQIKNNKPVSQEKRSKFKKLAGLCDQKGSKILKFE
ncbi:MAG: DNA primase [Elusimicrobiota bacterium]